MAFCTKKNIKLAKAMNARGFFFAEFEDKEGKCNGCGLCYLMCPDAAIEVYKEEK